jgi:hypothetical protein
MLSIGAGSTSRNRGKNMRRRPRRFRKEIWTMAAAEEQTNTPGGQVEKPLEDLGINEGNKKELEEDSAQEILQSLVEAQGELADENSVKGLNRHLRTKLYPLLSRTVSVVIDVGDTIRDVAENMADGVDGDSLSEEDVEFMSGFSEVIQRFVHKWMPTGKQLMDGGNPDFFNDLTALYKGSRGLSELVKLHSEEYEEIEDGGQS